MMAELRYATSRGLAVWHIIDMAGYLPTAFAPALCSVQPGGGTWLGYASLPPAGQTACTECERRAGGER